MLQTFPSCHRDAGSGRGQGRGQGQGQAQDYSWETFHFRALNAFFLIGAGDGAYEYGGCFGNSLRKKTRNNTCLI